MANQDQVKNETIVQSTDGPIGIVSKISSIIICIFTLINSVVMADRGVSYNYIFLSLFFAALLVAGYFGVQSVISRFRLLGLNLGRAVYCIVIGIIILGQVWSQIVCGCLFLALGIFSLVVHFVLGGGESSKKQQKKEQPPADLPAFSGVQQPMNKQG